MSDGPFLKSDRLSLYPLSLKDVHELYVMDSDPKVMKYINGGKAVVWDGYAHQVETWLQNMETRDGELGFFTARFNENNKFAGWFHLKHGTFYEEDIELGYRLKSAYWNQGLATEMSRLLLDYAFKDLKEDYVTATTLSRNTASRRVMEKLGMGVMNYFTYPEKLLPFWDDEERMAVKYGITREDYG